MIGLSVPENVSGLSCVQDLPCKRSFRFSSIVKHQCATAAVQTLVNNSATGNVSKPTEMGGV